MSNNDLNKRIIKWLTKQGYPLEMRVARILRKEGFSVSLGDMFDDLDTGTSREIDVTATKWVNGDHWIVRICFRFECKLSREKPWIVFTSRDIPDYYVGNLICSKLYLEFLMKALSNSNWRRKLSERQLFEKIHVGHGIARAFSEGEDVPYKAVMSAVKSAVAKVKEIDNLSKGRIEGYQYAISLPIVVVEGKLFEARLDDDGELEISNVQHSVINWKNAPTHSALVSIVTFDGFEDFASEMMRLANTLEAITFSNINSFEQMVDDYESIGF